MQPLLIEKEIVPDLRIVHKKETRSSYDLSMLRGKIYSAVVLGNSYKNKCRIIFEDAEGIKMIETTIWYAADTHIGLKGGITLPISCIKDVEI